MAVTRWFFSPAPAIILVAAFTIYQLIMRFSTLLPFFTGALLSFTGVQADDDSLKPLTIYAYGINATFIGYGARLTSLYVHDKNNTPRDVVVGYDDPARYIQDFETNHTYFGAVVGRYANRIKNGTFTVGTETSHIPENENGGKDTLHGGTMGYDARNWTVTQYNTSSITYSLLDPSGTQGFPGAVMNYVTFTVSTPPRLTSRIVSIALDQQTPIMLANHIYWNLGAFQTATILNDTLQLPYSERIIVIDTLEVPTGALESVKYPLQFPSVPLNFTAPKRIGDGALYSQQCGLGCTGIDNAFIIDRNFDDGPESRSDPDLIWTSADTGITLTVRTNQQSLELYSCNGQNGTIPNKAAQQGYGITTVDKYGCLVIETQQWIDGINNYGWAQEQRQIFGPDTQPAVNWAIYDFTVDGQPSPFIVGN